MTQTLADTVRAAPPAEPQILLGHPEAEGCDKTQVLQGGAFLPGRGGGRVSVWIETAGAFWPPATLIGDGPDSPPLAEAAWSAGSALSAQSCLGHLSGAGMEGIDFCTVTLNASAPANGTLWIAAEAGRAKDTPAWDAGTGTLQLGDGPCVRLEQPPNCVETLPAAGGFPPLALLGFSFALIAGETLRRTFRVIHICPGDPFAALIPRPRPYAALSADKGLAWCGVDWSSSLPGRVFAPDPRVAQTWSRAAYSLLASCDCGIPRTAGGGDLRVSEAQTALRALDLLGRFELGRSGCEWLAPLVFCGPGGAEADAPGQGICALVDHAEITDDAGWLAGQWGPLKTRVAWLERMTSADVPLRAVAPGQSSAEHPGASTVCLPAEGGLVQGRVGGELSPFPASAWALRGFRRAAEAAEALGYERVRDAWQVQADRLEAALAAHPLTPGAAAALAARLPADLPARHRDTLRLGLTSAVSAPVPAGTLHAAFRLGLDVLAWPALKLSLAEWLEPLAEWLERGPGAAAAQVRLLRDLFLRDDGDWPVLGPHLPPEWRVPGAVFGVHGLPTRFGLVSYEATVGPTGAVALEYDGPAEYTLGWGN